MTLLTILFSIIPAVIGIDIIGTYGCSAPACVFANSNLQFGTGSQTSVNAQGLFVQPFYYSHISNTWYKLTYSNYPLDTAFGSGTGGPNWSGTTVVDLYSLPISGSYTDYSQFIVHTADASKSVGYGVITATRNITVNGQLIIFQNRFSLGQYDNFVQITTRVTNIHTSPIQNMLIWVGTRDDYVGTTDVNIKTRGNLVNNQFVAVTTNSQSSHAIMITNPTEGVLFYSETDGVMTSYALCCAFANAYNTNPLTLAPATPTGTDGSYAAVLPIGNLSVGESASIIWYYAAGAISSLNAVVQNVSIAQIAAASPFATPSITSTPSSTPSTTVSISPTASESPSTSSTPSTTISISPTASISSTSTSTPSTSVSSTISISPTASVTTTSSQSTSVSPSTSISPTASTTVTQSPSSTASITPSITPSITSTITRSASISTSISPTASLSSTISPSSTASTTSTVSSTASPSPSDIIILQNNYIECYQQRVSLISAKEACINEKEACINEKELCINEKELCINEKGICIDTSRNDNIIILSCLLSILLLSICINICWFCRRRSHNHKTIEKPNKVEQPHVVSENHDIYAL